MTKNQFLNFALVLFSPVSFIVGCQTSGRNPSERRQELSAKSKLALTITKAGIGAVHLGMTLQQGRMVLPNARFVRSSDGEGVPLVDVRIGDQEAFTLDADENNRDSAVDWSKRIRSIETFCESCMTTEGVHPGMLVSDAEKVYGKVKQVFRSEIEQREFVSFLNQPRYYDFRIDYKGIFDECKMESKRFQPGAKIYSIAVFSGSD
jgi:hypothetical protein